MMRYTTTGIIKRYSPLFMRQSRFSSSNRMPILLYLIGLHFCFFHVPHLPPCLEAAAHEVKNVTLVRHGTVLWVSGRSPIPYCASANRIFLCRIPNLHTGIPALAYSIRTRHYLLSAWKRDVRWERPIVLDGTVFCLTLWTLFEGFRLSALIIA